MRSADERRRIAAKIKIPLMVLAAVAALLLPAADPGAAQGQDGQKNTRSMRAPVVRGPAVVVPAGRFTIQGATIGGNNGGNAGKVGLSNTGPGSRVTTGIGGGRKPEKPISGRPTRPHGPGILIGVPGDPPVVGIVQPVDPVAGNLPTTVVNLPPGGGNRRQSSSSQSPRRTASGVPPANERRYVANEVVVEMAAGTSAQAADAMARRFRLTRLQSQNFQLGGTTLQRWRIPDSRSVPTVVRALETDPNVLSAQPNFLAFLQQEPPQPAASASAGEPAQYALAKLRLPEAHGLAKGARVLIAVIDSGIDIAHPELQGVIADSLDTIGGADTAHPHGTAIAGAIAAHATLLGVAPAAQILAVRAFAAQRGDPVATTFNILAGLDWAAAKGARIINMSFAGPRDPAVSRSLAAARRKGIILIAAAGNAGPKSPPLYPAADPNVIAVTATDADDRLFQSANQGRHIAVAAPGVDLLLPAPDAGYKVTSGTSYAAAEVSGTVALMLERKPDLSPDKVRQILTATARDLGPKGADPQFGSGLIDPYRAILALEPVAADAAGNLAPAANRRQELKN